MADLKHLNEETRAALEADHGILQTFGLEVINIADGVCELDCTVPPNLVNAAGFAHGSIAFSVMDTACAYALRSVGTRGVTVHGDTHFVKGAAGGDQLYVRVEIVSRSRRVATLRGETYKVEDEERVLIAHGSFVFQLRVD